MEDLVSKIAMNHYRMSRALRAEAEHSPLSSMPLGDHDDRVKNPNAYSAMFAKTSNTSSSFGGSQRPTGGAKISINGRRGSPPRIS
jgi:hypothetical protein